METVLRMHRPGMVRRCWVNLGGGGASSASVVVHIVVDGDGRVSSAHAEGGSAQVGACLEKEIATWVFPARGEQTPVDLPLEFRSD
jgi:hypothetical protein